MPLNSRYHMERDRKLTHKIQGRHNEYKRKKGFWFITKSGQEFWSPGETPKEAWEAYLSEFLEFSDEWILAYHAYQRVFSRPECQGHLVGMSVYLPGLQRAGIFCGPVAGFGDSTDGQTVRLPNGGLYSLINGECLEPPTVDDTETGIKNKYCLFGKCLQDDPWDEGL